MGLSVGFKSFFLGIIVTSVVWSCIMYVYLHSNGSPKIFRRRFVSRYKPTFDEKSGTFEKAGDKKDDFPDPESNMIRDYSDYNEVPQDLGAAASDLSKVLNSSDLLTLGVIRTPEDQRIKDEGYHRHAFNLLISNRLGYHRAIPDTRNPLCKSQSYSSNLPSASIVICFYNEALSTLLRTVHTVLDRTPKELLHEIILVNDHSDNEMFISNLEKYGTGHFPSQVKLIKTPERAGLIRARLFGARQATGQILMFLDSHCEVNVGWLEPLIERIHEKRSRVVCPIIDIINSDAFEYSASPLVKGGFNWGLHFKWDQLPQMNNKEDFIRPVQSPTMAGGLFAIDRKYFHELGEYDEGMDIWGGENLEISFRIWMCGGTLEIIPCSRVGHVFRKRRPYGSPNGEDTLTRNSLRVVHVWLDEYKEYYFTVRPDAKDKLYGDISARVALRKRLNCTSFDWYLKTVYPELKAPESNSQVKSNILALQKNNQAAAGPVTWRRTSPPVVQKFQIQLSGSHLCIESEEEVTTKGSLLILQKCTKIKRQTWYETEKHDLRLANLLCLDAGERYPRLYKCHEMGSHQDWRHSKKRNSPFYNPSAGLCLGAPAHKSGEHVTLELCDSPRAAKWNVRTSR